jgi:hypothetical protein
VAGFNISGGKQDDYWFDWELVTVLSFVACFLKVVIEEWVRNPIEHQSNTSMPIALAAKRVNEAQQYTDKNVRSRSAQQSNPTLTL